MTPWQDDVRLLAALRKRNPDAFQWLFDQYADKIFRLAVGLLQNEVEADGIVQDTFLKWFEHQNRFEGRSTIGTWLYRVAYNLCQDQLRRRRPVLDLPHFDQESDGLPFPTVFVDWTTTPERIHDSRELSAVLAEAINQLPLTLKTAFLMRDIEGMPTAECAHTLNISISACKVRLHRARLLLREQLAASALNAGPFAQDNQEMQDA